MSFRGGEVYNSVNEITGPIGWYRIKGLLTYDEHKKKI